MDLKKTYDTVHRNILLKMLEYYGIRRVFNDWFKSNLSDHKQFVCINGYNFACGETQNSVSEPLFFFIYISDFHKAIQHCSLC